MFKYIIFAITLNVIMFLGFFSKENVFLHLGAPAAAEAGTTIEVELELHKSAITGFARFQQELPPGITASPVYPSDVNFSFDENTVRMIWLNLPGDKTFTVRYRLHIDERLKGELKLEGTFSYIENNERMTASAEEITVNITPSPHIDEELIVDLSEADKLHPPVPATYAPVAEAVAVRQLPVEDDDRGYLVNIMINKGDRSSFAKIEERVPRGFTAEAVESRGGTFSFSDQIATIIWRKLPPENNFIVSYRLIPDELTDEAPRPEGSFSFMHDNITTTYHVVERDIPLSSLEGAGKQELIASAALEVRTTAPERSPAARPPSTPLPSAPAAVMPERGLTRPLPPEQGVYYRVQLAAGRRPVDPESYFKHLDIPFNIHTEIHEGWYKYSVGSFYDYRSARDQRVNIWNTTPVGDAFVSAYNDGLRITVQEALAIANHRWYR